MDLQRDVLDQTGLRDDSVARPLLRPGGPVGRPYHGSPPTCPRIDP